MPVATRKRGETKFNYSGMACDDDDDEGGWCTNSSSSHDDDDDDDYLESKCKAPSLRQQPRSRPSRPACAAASQPSQRKLKKKKAEVETALPPTEYQGREGHAGLATGRTLAAFLRDKNYAEVVKELLTGQAISEVGMILHQLAGQGGGAMPWRGQLFTGILSAFTALWRLEVEPKLEPLHAQLHGLDAPALDTPALAKAGCLDPPLGSSIMFLKMMCEAHERSCMRPGGESEVLSCAVVEALRTVPASMGLDVFIMVINFWPFTCVKGGSGQLNDPCIHGHANGDTNSHLEDCKDSFKFLVLAWAALAGYAGCRLLRVVDMESLHHMFDFNGLPQPHPMATLFLGLSDQLPAITKVPHTAFLHIRESRHAKLVTLALAAMVEAVAGSGEGAQQAWDSVCASILNRGFLPHLKGQAWPGCPGLPPICLDGTAAEGRVKAVMREVTQLEVRLVQEACQEFQGEQASSQLESLLASVQPQQQQQARAAEKEFKTQLAQPHFLIMPKSEEPSGGLKSDGPPQPKPTYSSAAGSVSPHGLILVCSFPPHCTPPGGLLLDRGGAPIWTFQQAVGPVLTATGGDPIELSPDLVQRGQQVTKALIDSTLIYDLLGENDLEGPVRGGWASPSKELAAAVLLHRLERQLDLVASLGDCVPDMWLLSQEEAEAVLRLLDPSRMMGEGDDEGTRLSFNVIGLVDVTAGHEFAQQRLLGGIYPCQVWLCVFKSKGQLSAIRLHCLHHLSYKGVASLAGGLQGITPELLWAYFDGPIFGAAAVHHARASAASNADMFTLLPPSDKNSPMRPSSLHDLLSELGGRLRDAEGNLMAIGRDGYSAKGHNSSVIETAVASALPGQMPVDPRTRQPLTTTQIEKGKKAKKRKSEGGAAGLGVSKSANGEKSGQQVMIRTSDSAQGPWQSEQVLRINKNSKSKTPGALQWNRDGWHGTLHEARRVRGQSGLEADFLNIDGKIYKWDDDVTKAGRSGNVIKGAYVLMWCTDGTPPGV